MVETVFAPQALVDITDTFDIIVPPFAWMAAFVFIEKIKAFCGSGIFQARTPGRPRDGLLGATYCQV